MCSPVHNDSYPRRSASWAAWTPLGEAIAPRQAPYRPSFTWAHSGVEDRSRRAAQFAAVHWKNVAGEEAGCVRGEELERCRAVLDLHDSTHRVSFLELDGLAPEQVV